jgi:hypothetical protein
VGTVLFAGYEEKTKKTRLAINLGGILTDEDMTKIIEEGPTAGFGYEVKSTHSGSSTDEVSRVTHIAGEKQE